MAGGRARVSYWPTCTDTRQQTLEAYRTLEGFVEQGKVRQIGVSNIYDPEMLEWMIGEAKVELQVVQNRYVVVWQSLSRMKDKSRLLIRLIGIRWHEGNGWDWESRCRDPSETIKADDIVYDICQAKSIRYQ